MRCQCAWRPYTVSVPQLEGRLLNILVISIQARLEGLRGNSWPPAKESMTTVSRRPTFQHVQPATAQTREVTVQEFRDWPGSSMATRSRRWRIGIGNEVGVRVILETS